MPPSQNITILKNVVLSTCTIFLLYMVLLICKVSMPTLEKFLLESYIDFSYCACAIKKLKYGHHLQNSHITL